MKQQEKILVVDDEREIAELIRLYLVNEGFEVFVSYDGRSALERVSKQLPDLAILDVMLPDIDGFTLCKTIREKHLFPVIMLTAKTDEVNKITGLTLGADDYITKPFLPLEVVARVKAQLRRYKTYQGATSDQEDILEVGGLVIDKRTHGCSLDGQVLHFTPTEFAILKTLAEKKGQVMSSDELSQEIWKEEYFEKGNSSITVHIRHIREKMGDTFEKPRYIKTVWGIGYRLDYDR